MIDTKWKCLTDRTVDRKRGVKPGDLYQMMAYAQLYHCNRLVLLYPHRAGLVSTLPAHHCLAHASGPVRLTIASVDRRDQ